MTEPIRHTSESPGPNIGLVLKSMWQRSCHSVSLIIVAVCAAVFVGVAILDLLALVPRSQSFSFLGLSFFGVAKHHLIHQFLTAPLMHGSVGHLLFNMLSLWLLGPDVEKMLGRVRYLAFTFICAESSMIGFLLMSGGTEQIVLGYSGVIFGLLVAHALYFPNNVLAIFAFFPMRMKHAVLLLGAVELYLTVKPETAGIANAAHLFGAVAAWIYLRGPAGWQSFRRKMTRPIQQAAWRKRIRDAGKIIPNEL